MLRHGTCARRLSDAAPSGQHGALRSRSRRFGSCSILALACTCKDYALGLKLDALHASSAACMIQRAVRAKIRAVGSGQPWGLPALRPPFLVAYNPWIWLMHILDDDDLASYDSAEDVD